MITKPRYSLRYFLFTTFVCALFIGVYFESRRRFSTAVRALRNAGVEVWRYDVAEYDIFPQLGIYNIRIHKKLDSHILARINAFDKLRTLSWENPDPNDLELLENLNVDEIKITGGTDQVCSNLSKAKTIRHLAVSGIQFTGRELYRLESLTRLQSLSLSYSNVSDDSIASISRLADLQSLSLANTTISDVGISRLDLKHLCSLDLQGTRITDSSLTTIARMSSLKYLNVRGSQISEDGLCTELGSELEKSLRSIAVTSVVIDNAGGSRLQRKFPLCSINASTEFKFNPPTLQ